jgi:hypothetical protein
MQAQNLEIYMKKPGFDRIHEVPDASDCPLIYELRCVFIGVHMPKKEVEMKPNYGMA